MKTNAHKFRNVNEEEFNRLKVLTNLDLKNKDIQKIANRGYMIVCKVEQAKDFNDYLELTKQESKKHIAKKLAKIGTESTQELEEITKEMTLQTLPDESETHRMVVALEKIAQATSRLADAWEAAPKSKSFFK